MLKFLKPIKSAQQQLASLPKLYFSHLWITPPSMDGLSYLGISDYAKKHFVRINKIDFECFPKTAFGIKNRQYNRSLVDETRQMREKGDLPLSQKIEWQRFSYKQGEVFAVMETIEFDVQLQAPLDMWVVEQEWHSYYFRFILSSPFLFKIAILNHSQLQLLMSEQEYLNSNKMIL